MKFILSNYHDEIDVDCREVSLKLVNSELCMNQ